MILKFFFLIQVQQYLAFLCSVTTFRKNSCEFFFPKYFQVAEVEEEMREMLSENQASKKAMEDKMKRLTQAMTDLQTDLYQ